MKVSSFKRFGKLYLATALALIMTMSLSWTAFADEIRTDADISTPGDQSVRSFTTTPGALISFATIHQIRYSGNEHVSPNSIVLLPGSTNIPGAHHISTAFIEIPYFYHMFMPTSAWAWTTVNFIAPPTSGSYWIRWTPSAASTGLTGYSEVTINITISDSMPPSITLASQPGTLWPPSHQYETVAVSSFVTAASDGEDSEVDASDVVITRVTSDEDEDAPGGGDGNTLDDIVIAADGKSVQLRAERQGSGNGRVYTIHVAVSDRSGNTATASYQVQVPKSQNGQAAEDDGVAYTVSR